MSPIWIAIAILSGITIVSDPLIGESRVLRRRDPQVGYRNEEPLQVSYRVWTAPSWDGHADKNGICRVVVFARVLGRGDMRMRFSGNEQNLDDSWSWDIEVKEGEELMQALEFIEPIGGVVSKNISPKFKCRERVREPEKFYADADLSGV